MYLNLFIFVDALSPTPVLRPCAGRQDGRVNKLSIYLSFFLSFYILSI